MLRRIVAVVLLGGLVLACACNGRQPWPVPSAAKEVANPVAPGDAVLAAAAPLYAEKCMHCHGEQGRGDGPEAKTYSTKPADFTDAAMMDGTSDGELFYKITTGRRPMPSFEKQLSETQRWQLVHFIRDFAQKTGKDPK